MSFSSSQMSHFFTLGIIFSLILILASILVNKKKNFIFYARIIPYCLAGMVASIFLIIGLRFIQTFIDQAESISFLHGIMLYMFLFLPIELYLGIIDRNLNLNIFRKSIKEINEERRYKIYLTNQDKDQIEASTEEEYQINGITKEQIGNTVILNSPEETQTITYNNNSVSKSYSFRNNSAIIGIITSATAIMSFKNIILLLRDLNNTSLLIKSVIFSIITIILLIFTIITTIKNDINKGKLGALISLILVSSGIFFGVLGIKNYLDKDSYIKTDAEYRKTTKEVYKQTSTEANPEKEIIPVYEYQFEVNGITYTLTDSTSSTKENKLGDLKTIYYYQSDPSNNKLKKPLNIEYIKASGILLVLGAISILINNINKHNKEVNNLANPTNNIHM